MYAAAVVHGAAICEALTVDPVAASGAAPRRHVATHRRSPVLPAVAGRAFIAAAPTTGPPAVGWR